MTTEMEAGTETSGQTARELFEGGRTCSVAMVTRYAPLLGKDAETLALAAGGFAGGVAGLGELCGALSGAVMVLGLKYSPVDQLDKEARQTLWQVTRKFLAEFEAEKGALSCAELLERDISTAQGVASAREDGAFERVCPGVVETAGRILEQYLEWPADDRG